MPPHHRSAGAPPLEPKVASLRALAHPLRLRMFELFAESPRTTMQVAEVLKQPPTRLYHHVNLLERAGLLRVRETRANRGTVEKWYEAAQPAMLTASQAQSAMKGPGAKSMGAVAGAIFNQATRELMAAVADHGDEPPMAMRAVVVGSRARREIVRKAIHKMIRDLRALGALETPRGKPAKPHASPERWALTMSFAPAWPEAK